jgi:hypothetical protein
MASKPEISCQEILTKVSQEKLTKKGGLRRFLSRNLYKNVFIKKTTPLFSDRLKGAIRKKKVWPCWEKLVASSRGVSRNGFEKSAVVHGDLAVYKKMRRKLSIL